MTDRRDDESAGLAPAAFQAAEPPPAGRAADAKRDGPGLRPAIAGGLFLLLAAVLALVGSSPYWAPALAPLLPWGKPAADQSGIVRIAALEQRLAAVEEQRRAALAGTGAPDAAIAALADRVAALERRPAAAGAETLEPLRSDVARLGDETGQLRAALGRAEARLATLEQGQAKSDAEADRLLLVAIDQLRAAIETSRPFADELGTVAALGRDRPELRPPLQSLADMAPRGIPGKGVLAVRFEQETAQAVLSAAATPARGGWGAAILAKLRSLVVIRRIGDGAASAAATPQEAAVATAETALGSGDLSGAVRALETLSGPPAEAARPWLAEARRRLAAETAVAQLARAVAGGLAESRGAARSETSTPAPAGDATPGAPAAPEGGSPSR